MRSAAWITKGDGHVQLGLSARIGSETSQAGGVWGGQAQSACSDNSLGLQICGWQSFNIQVGSGKKEAREDVKKAPNLRENMQNMFLSRALK